MARHLGAAARGRANEVSKLAMTTPSRFGDEELQPSEEPHPPLEDGDGEEVATGLVSGVKVELVDWAKYSRPCEIALLSAIGVMLLFFGIFGDEWIVGYNADLELVTVGLRWSRVASQPWDALNGMLANDCTVSGSSRSLACLLGATGKATAAIGWIAFMVVGLLGATFIAQALDSIGLLNSARAKLPPTLPLGAIASYGPTACWALLLVLLFLMLLAYASLAPASLGGGLARLGVSYGVVRLAWLLGLIGFGVNLSLGHKLGDEHVVMLLDALRGRWSHMTRAQKLVQVLLVLALMCALLLWVRRVDWSVLLLVYGLWAHAEHSHDHLSVFACVAIFSTCTDALFLAGDGVDSVLFIEVITWMLVGCKLIVVTMLACTREAFV